MNQVYRRFVALVTLLGLAILTSSCVKKKEQLGHEIEYPYQVTCTVGMISTLAKAIGGTHVAVDTLVGSGIDPHSYRPTKTDIDTINTAQVVFYNGHLLEGKMGEVLESAKTDWKPVIAVSEKLSDYQIIGGDSHPDPHVWMDPAGWSKAAKVIADSLAAFDPTNADEYQHNYNILATRLTALDGYARSSLATIPEGQRVLVTAHDAFSYLGRAYNLEVRGIQGISTESEAGLQEINQLVDYLVEKKIPAVFVESSVSPKSVQALVEGAKAKGHEVVVGGELFSDAMGAPSTYEGTYEGMIDHNITTITRALGGQAPEGGLNNKLEAVAE